MLQIKHFVALAVVALFLAPSLSVSAQPTPEECHDLFVVAWTLRDSLRGHPDHLRDSAAARQRHRDSHRQLLEAAERARKCYEHFVPDSPDATAAPSRDTSARIDSLARARIKWTYFYMVLGHRELDEFSEALQDYDTYFRRFGSSPDSSHLKLMYHMRAFQEHRRGNTSQAVDDYIQTYNYIPPADTARRARMLLELGIILQEVNDMERAQRYYQQAEQQLASLQSPSVNARSLLARSLFLQGDLLLDSMPDAPDSVQTAIYHQGIGLLSEALDTFPENTPKQDVDSKLGANISLGEAYARLGEFDRAHEYLNRGKQLAEELGHASELVLAYKKEGNIRLIEGMTAEAEAPLLRAIDYAEQGVAFDLHHRALNLLARTYERLERWDAAEARFREAVQLIEDHRASLRATGWATAAFDDWSRSYHGLVRVLIAQERHQEAFATLERSRARHLQDTRLQARVTNELPSGKRLQFDSLTTALAATRTQMAQSASSDPQIAELQTQEAELMAERRSLVGLRKLNLPPLSDIQAHLRAQNQTLLSFFLDAPAEDQSTAFVVTPDTLHAVPLAITEDDLDEALPAISPMLSPQSGSDVDISSTRFDLNVLHRLHEQLIGPVERLLPAEGRLVIVPEGPLFRLPFGMLVRETPGRFAYTEARYLMEAYSISTELGTALLTDSTASDRATRFDVVALGQTDFASGPSLPRAMRGPAYPDSTLPPLPGVDTEMAALSDLFGNRRLLLDDAASEAAFYDLQDEAKVLHLASHALVNEADPRNNLFVLSPSSGHPKHDGLLYLHELERNRSPIPLVVLSGCSTARGLHQSGEGPIGLQYAFRAMGAQSTLSTLWPTDDQAAVALTTAFYRHLQNGLPKDVALQRAQRDFLQSNPKMSSPFFWAAPVLYGTPRPLPLSPPANWMYYLSGGALLLIFSLAVIYRRSQKT